MQLECNMFTQSFNMKKVGYSKGQPGSFCSLVSFVRVKAMHHLVHSVYMNQGLLPTQRSGKRRAAETSEIRESRTVQKPKGC